MAADPRVGPLRALVSDLEQALARIDAGGNRYLSLAEEGPIEVEGNGAGRAPHLTLEGPPIPDKLVESAESPAHSGAPSGGTAYATLEALQFAFRDCRACKLCATRNRIVFGAGAPRPRILFVGEGPGAEEDAQGLPFVGRAGSLLNGFIAALGLTRPDVYITNVVKCRPPGNRNPEPDEVASCRPILMQQLQLLNPRLIVTLGNVPLKTLKPAAAGITRERGRTFTFMEWTVLPTFHPSFLLRSPGEIPACWQDFREAFRLAYQAN